MSRWISARLRVIAHVGIRVHALRIALYAVRREELPDGWIVVSGNIVIQSCYAIGELTCKANAGWQRPHAVADRSVGVVELSTYQIACGIQHGDLAAQCIVA